MERIWAAFEPLVRALRYSTKQHRLSALNFQAKHKNERGQDKAVVNSLNHLNKTTKKMADSSAIFMELNICHGHSEKYFHNQWVRKNAIQSQIISQISKDYLEHVVELIDLEEKLIAAQRQRRRGHGRRKQAGLPNTLVLLEKAIDNVSDKPGDPQLIELTGRSDARAKPLVQICVAKGNLLGAKAGVIEHQQCASHARGMAIHATYWRLANDFNNGFCPKTLLSTPSLQEVKAMPLKARQMVCWAVEYQEKINIPCQNTMPDHKDVMMALTETLTRQACRNWLRWNSKILVLLDKTADYNVCETTSNDELKAKWTSMMEFTLQEWENMVQIQTLNGEQEDDDDEWPVDDDVFDNDGIEFYQ
ncbi:hypothetical protein DFH28DRAFT_1078971 [Melampsora americana]|nr:hypothetical protein DFH28DRAFT_1078971 [Melampsora americana]